MIEILNILSTVCTNLYIMLYLVVCGFDVPYSYHDIGCSGITGGDSGMD